MSSLEKLAIRGIRSFDSQDLAVMQFYTPLTVIVGANGSGKTTIIECLKYATTGDLPPNAKGGAFVHDPHIAGVAEVKATVKLRFNNIKDQLMMVERRLQVTRKKTGNGLTMKTLEGTVTFIESPSENEPRARKTLSTKCAALDEEIPKQLGVSKAILENVIFCHQEESNWPLAEPASLKKKFDDIFEATKYTKALDAIKNLKKAQVADNKVAKERLAALKIDKERSKKLTVRMNRMSQELDLKRINIEKYDVEINIRRVSNREFYEKGLKYLATINNHKTLDTRKKIVSENLAQLKVTIIELKETDQALQNAADNSAENLDQIRKNKNLDNQKLQDETDALAAAERKRTEIFSKEGGLKARKERYERTLQERQILIQRLATQHNITGFNHDLSPQEITDFSDRLDDLVRAQQSKIETMKAEARKVEATRQEELGTLRSAVASNRGLRESLAEPIRALTFQIDQQMRKLDNSRVSEGDITYDQKTLDSEKARKIETEKDLEEQKFGEKIAAGESELKKLEESREALLETLSGLNKQAETRAALGLKRADLKNKEESIQSTLDDILVEYRELAKKDLVKANMDKDISDAVGNSKFELSSAEGDAFTAGRALKDVESGINANLEKIRALTLSADDIRRDRLSSLAKCESFNGGIANGIIEFELELKAANLEVNKSKGNADFYAENLKAVEKHKICLGCDRGLRKEEMAAFREFCNKRLEASKPEGDAVASVKEWEDQIKILKNLLPLEEQEKKQRAEIVEAQKAKFDLSEKVADATTVLDEATIKVRECKAKLESLQSLKRSALDVTRMTGECEGFKRSIDLLEGELRDTGSIATSDEVQAQLVEISNKTKTVKYSVESARNASIQQNRVLQRVVNSIHSLELSLNVKKQELKDRQALELQRQKNQEELTRLEAEKLELDQKVRAEAAPVRKLEEELAQARSESAALERQAGIVLTSLSTSRLAYDENNREIQKYASEGVEQRLQAVRDDITRAEAAINKIKGFIVDYQRKISEADKKESESKSDLRNVNDNIRFRKESIALAKISEEIDSLGLDEAKAASVDYEKRYRLLEDEVTELQAKKATLEGEVAAQQVTLAGFETEQRSEYSNINARFRKEEVNVKTVEGASADLDKYGKALDSAIMSFHGHKMEEINNTLKDLWVKTYQGTDIDGISIKSDAESKTAGARSYNYRVVMAKDNVEMDMRGRCSAGQKVLASIIIRLALAESFSVNCGILALDEPTTNLDKENIDALSRSLADIIKERAMQKNFQLIVITHDETFLEILGGQGVLDQYWRVKRADDGKTSTILRQKLS